MFRLFLTITQNLMTKNHYVAKLQKMKTLMSFRAVLAMFLCGCSQVRATTKLHIFSTNFNQEAPKADTNQILKFGKKQLKWWKVMDKIVKSSISCQSLWKIAFSPEFSAVKRSELFSFRKKYPWKLGPRINEVFLT